MNIKQPIRNEARQDMARLVGTFGLSGRTRWWLVLQAMCCTFFLLFALLSWPSQSTALAGGGLNCNQTTVPTYTVEICLLAPVANASLTGVETISATAEIISGTDVGVRRMTFYLNDAYLLLDNRAPYLFELPSDHFVDGSYTLGITTTMKDQVVISNTVTVDVTFDNGVTSPPTNTNTFTPYTGTQPGPGEPFVVAATGDGAGPRDEVDPVTDLVVAQDPDMFLYLGDVYEKGTYTEFYNWYGTPDRKYGRFRDITNPIIGNHEYEDGEAPGYFFYWDNVPNYYSYDAGGWHFIALNSNSQFDEDEVPGEDIYDETEPGSLQYEWLLNDLEANSSLCTIVYFHHPVVSVGKQGDTERMNDMWQVMADYGVDIVLTGHDHSYQRWDPLDRDLNANPQGMTQFVHGAGGHGVQSFDPEREDDDRLAIGYDTSDSPETLGVLRLELNPTGADFSYTNIENERLDSGQIPCRETLPDTTPPSRPSNVVVESQNDSQISFSWDASTDFPPDSTHISNRNSVDNVAGYTIYRNGLELATITDSLRYTDTTVQPDYLYLYTVDAFDSEGNHSNPSDPLEIMTIPTIMLNPVADAYVRDNENKGDNDADRNFGNEDRLRTDGNPDTVSYLRFDVPDYEGHLLKATLRIYADNEGSQGYSVSRVADNSWDELTITYNQRPPVGEDIGSVEPFPQDTWTEIDVSSLIHGSGLLSLAISTTSDTNVDYSSRESTQNKPELVLRVFERLHINPVADSYVKEDEPDVNFGSQQIIRTDAYSETNSTLRFDVPNLNSENMTSTLRVYAESFGNQGYNVHDVADNSWDELSITYNSAPAIGSFIASSQPFGSDSWTEVDVSEVISSDSMASLALTSDSATNTRYSSREGTNPPELRLEPIMSACGGLIQEAERGTLHGDFVIGTDGVASGGEFIHVPPGAGNHWNGANSIHKADYCFNVDTAGTYRIKGSVYAETGADNSFYVQVDGTPSNGYLWYIPKNTNYQMDYVSNRDEPDLVEVTLSAGQHTLSIFLREDGARLDKLELELVDSNPGNQTCEPTLEREAEEGHLTGAFVIGDDNKTPASGGQYVHVPNGAGNNFNMPDPVSQAEYCFDIDSAGRYRIKAGVYAETGADNSFFVKVDDAPSNGYRWYIPKNTTYQEDYVSDRSGADAIEVDLSAGQHTVTIFLREDGARLDRLELELVTTPSPPPAIVQQPRGIVGTLLVNKDHAQEELDLSGINLTLVDAETGGNGYNERTQTDHLGQYYFDEMPTGQYELTLELPEGYSSSQPTEVEVSTSAEQMVEVSFDVEIAEDRSTKIYLPVVKR